MVAAPIINSIGNGGVCGVSVFVVAAKMTVAYLMAVVLVAHRQRSGNGNNKRNGKWRHLVKGGAPA